MNGACSVEVQQRHRTRRTGQRRLRRWQSRLRRCAVAFVFFLLRLRCYLFADTPLLVLNLIESQRYNCIRIEEKPELPSVVPDVLLQLCKMRSVAIQRVSEPRHVVIQR